MNIKLLNAISILGVLLIGATIFYHEVENWSWVDSFYFTSVTLTTIGYGDVHPVKDVSKIFTAVFAITGVSAALYSLTVIGSDYFVRRESQLVNILRTANGVRLQKGKGDIIRVDRHVGKLLSEIDRLAKK